MASKQIIDSELETFSCSLTPGQGRKRSKIDKTVEKKRQRYSSHGKIPVIVCRHNNKRCKAGNLGNLDIVSELAQLVLH